MGGSIKGSDDGEGEGAGMAVYYSAVDYLTTGESYTHTQHNSLHTVPAHATAVHQGSGKSHALLLCERVTDW
jgi:hypothetical protein